MAADRIEQEREEEEEEEDDQEEEEEGAAAAASATSARGGGEPAAEDAPAPAAIVAARWEAWADRPDGAPEVYAWMMTRLPASRRKPFTEAVLRALWPRAGRHHRRRRRQHQGRSLNSRFFVDGGWPPGFQTAACRVLVGRPLVGARRPRRRRRRRRKMCSGLEGGRVAALATDAMDAGESLSLSLSGAWVGEEEQRDGSADVSIGLVEGLLLQSPLPPPAAEAVADTLAWCDRRRRRRGHEATTAATVAATAAKAYTGRAGGEGDRGGGLVMGALKRVAAVWAEPSFLNRSPPRQQEFYTRFLLAALRSDGVDGQALTSGDALFLLIRGVGTHLDVPTRATRLRGMRVGEAVSRLTSQNLRFAELDGERGQEGAGAEEAGGGGGG
ncbi:unnamed protein product, partial [Laminaria digitata]